MEGAQYQVKLYGHTAESSEVFCKDLAQLLGMSIEQAQSLLNELPVVVAEMGKLEQAEYLRHRLTGIRALALVDGPESSDVFQGEEAATQTREPLPGITTEARERKDDLMARVWMLLLVGISGLALLVGAVVFLVQFKRMRAENVKTTTPQTVSAGAEQPVEQTPSPSEIEARKRQRIKVLQDEIGELKFQTSWQKDMLKQAEHRRPIDYEELRRLKVLLAATEEKIAATFRELRKVRGR